MTVEKMKKYPGMVVVKMETEKKALKLRKEIGDLEGKIYRAEVKCENGDRVASLRKMKEERLRVTEALLAKLEEATLEVEAALEAIAPELTPLEHIIILKLYIEGMKWNQLMDEL